MSLLAPRWWGSALIVSIAALSGCSAGDPPGLRAGGSGSGSGATGSGATGGSSGRGGSGNETGGANSGGSGGDRGGSGGSQGGSGGSVGGSGGTTELPAESLLPARIRRLTTQEYAASVRALLNQELPVEVTLPPDGRQDGFTRNESQRVDPVLAKQLDSSAQLLAAQAKTRLTELAPCAGAAQGETCARDFIETFGARAYRRALDPAEVDALLTVYGIGAEGAAYADGIELVIRAVLQSPGFLYLTELGDGSSTDRIALTAGELASALSYLLTAEPPDAELLAAAESGALFTPEGRAAEARRLLELQGTGRAALLRHLREWLGLDRLAETGKDSTVYGKYTDNGSDGRELRLSMMDETDAFLGAVTAENGTVRDLLAADWTMADRDLAEFYGVQYPAGASGFQRVSLEPTIRRGILNQAAFLAVYAHASESAPVFRGVAVLKRIGCQPKDSPATLNEVVPPPPVPDPNKTTRERFSEHSTNSKCAGCHAPIDAIGFAFEAFDGMGEFRETENGKDVDSTTEIIEDFSLGFSGEFADSGELAVALAESADVRVCFARHLFRSAAAASGTRTQASEDAFVEAWRVNPAAEPGNIVETLITFVSSPLIAYRRPE